MEITATKVTMEHLRSIPMGESMAIKLPNADACNNGKTLAYQNQYGMGCKFSASTDYKSNTLTLTKNPT